MTTNGKLTEKIPEELPIPVVKIFETGSVLVWTLRAIFLAIMMGLAVVAFQYFSDLGSRSEKRGLGPLAGMVVIFLAALVIATDLLVQRKEITTISAVYFGLLLGLLLGNLLATGLNPIFFDFPMGIDKELPQDTFVRRCLQVMISVICCYISISTLLQTKENFRFIIPFIEFSKQTKGKRPLVLDTSVIIDGRIADVCEARFIDSKIMVPRFVLLELQAVADSGDKLKRNRGRRGLDILKRIQNNKEIDFQLHDGLIPGVAEQGKVDERLVQFTKAVGGKVVTNDFNLNKMAQLEGVEVLNLNELANSLKSVALPGEVLMVRIVKNGDQPGQGVGYLEDGTMVVVEQGRNSIGQEAAVVVTSALQTPAGRMVFGRFEGKGA
jgi:uncharacterized protein YacL